MQGNSNDATGNANNGSDTAITYGTAYGKINEGASFNGTSSYINLGTPSDLNITGALSICAWVHPTNFSNYWWIVAKTVGNGGTQETYEFRIEATTGKINLLGPGTNAISTVALTAGAWNFVCATRDASNNVALYVNGSAAGTGTSAAPTSLATTPTYIGTRGDNYTYFNGYQDEIGIWSRVLTSTEVSTLYNGGAGLTYPFSSAAPKVYDIITSWVTFLF